MSIVICDGCDRPIDSDFDGDCFVEVGNMRRLHKTVALCERYRDDRAERADDEANAEAQS